MGDGDTGPNTGGMGSYSPAPVLTPAIEEQAMRDIVVPTARAMCAEGVPFRGVLFAGLMIKDGQVRAGERPRQGCRVWEQGGLLGWDIEKGPARREIGRVASGGKELSGCYRP